MGFQGSHSVKVLLVFLIFGSSRGYEGDFHGGLKRNSRAELKGRAIHQGTYHPSYPHPGSVEFAGNDRPHVKNDVIRSPELPGTPRRRPSRGRKAKEIDPKKEEPRKADKEKDEKADKEKDEKADKEKVKKADKERDKKGDKEKDTKADKAGKEGKKKDENEDAEKKGGKRDEGADNKKDNTADKQKDEKEDVEKEEGTKDEETAAHGQDQTTLFPAALFPTTLPPSTVSPSTLTPSSLTPSTLSHSSLPPSTLTPSMLTPSSLTPSTLSPSTLTPSSLTPSTLSPSTLTPSSLTPSTLSPSTLIPTDSSSDEKSENPTSIPQGVLDYTDESFTFNPDDQYAPPQNDEVGEDNDTAGKNSAEVMVKAEDNDSSHGQDDENNQEGDGHGGENQVMPCSVDCYGNGGFTIDNEVQDGPSFIAVIGFSVALNRPNIDLSNLMEVAVSSASQIIESKTTYQVITFGDRRELHDMKIFGMVESDQSKLWLKKKPRLAYSSRDLENVLATLVYSEESSIVIEVTETFAGENNEPLLWLACIIAYEVRHKGRNEVVESGLMTSRSSKNGDLERILDKMKRAISESILDGSLLELLQLSDEAIQGVSEVGDEIEASLLLSIAKPEPTVVANIASIEKGSIQTIQPLETSAFDPIRLGGVLLFFATLTLSLGLTLVGARRLRARETRENWGSYLGDEICVQSFLDAGIGQYDQTSIPYRESFHDHNTIPKGSHQYDYTSDQNICPLPTEGNNTGTKDFPTNSSESW